MRDTALQSHTHGHSFGQERPRPGERRTMTVIAITLAMMVVEIAAGVGFTSMALLADGLHMASHAAALSITALAYVYARRHARDSRFSFGTGKVNALGGFAGALLLAGFAAAMGVESVLRLAHPEAIAFDGAILIAVIGLCVNGACALLLGGGHDHHHAHGHGRDLNLKAAYAHVLADAVTSLLAIAALLTAKYFGLIWMDPVMGVVGAALVGRWSLGLLRSTSHVLLDRQAPADQRARITRLIEDDGSTRVTDLHMWSIGPGVHAAEIAVVALKPVSPDTYKARVPRDLGIEHLSVEVHSANSA